METKTEQVGKDVTKKETGRRSFGKTETEVEAVFQTGHTGWKLL